MGTRGGSHKAERRAADRASRSPRQERRAHEQARRREDALSAATTVFAEKGFYETQITEIAALAELSRASLYEIFKGKEELYQEVIRTSVERMRHEVIAQVEAIACPRERVLTLIDALLGCFENNRDALRIILSGTQGLPWRIHRNMGDPSRIEDFRGWVIKLCNDARKAGALQGIDPETVALSLIGSVMNTADHALQRDPDRPLTRLSPGVRELFSRALGEPA